MQVLLNLAKMLKELESLHPTVRVTLFHHASGIIIEVSWMQDTYESSLYRYRQVITESYMENSKDISGEVLFNHLVKRVREEMQQDLKDKT